MWIIRLFWILALRWARWASFIKKNIALINYFILIFTFAVVKNKKRDCHLTLQGIEPVPFRVERQLPYSTSSEVSHLRDNILLLNLFKSQNWLTDSWPKAWQLHDKGRNIPIVGLDRIKLIAVSESCFAWKICTRFVISVLRYISSLK